MTQSQVHLFMIMIQICTIVTVAVYEIMVLIFGFALLGDKTIFVLIKNVILIMFIIIG